jgi:GTPase
VVPYGTPVPAKAAAPARPLLETSAANIEIDRESVAFALPGDIVGINLAKVAARQLHRGMVLGELKSDRSPVATFQPDTFIAEIIIFNKPPSKSIRLTYRSYGCQW